MPPKSTSATSSSRRAPAGAAKRGSTSTSSSSSSKRRRETTDTIELASDQDDEDLDMFDHSGINNDLSMLGSDDDDDDDDDRQRRRRRMQQGSNGDDLDVESDRYQQASDLEDQDQDDEEESDEEEEDEDRPTVPSDLLTHLLYEFFESDKTKITKDANEAVAKYVDIFVREAIARSVVERQGGNNGGTITGGGGGVGGGFLEVEDLEKVVPQLLLDL
ncbi:CENP-S associating centromere protein X-domain-containing protein, partial [Sordaria brevicollis]